MVIKHEFGTSFRKLIAYLNDKGRKGHAHAELFDSNLGDGTLESIIESLEAYASLNERISKPVWHIIVAFEPDERHRLDDSDMRFFAEEVLHESGIPDPAFAAFRHAEGLHIVTTTVGPNKRRLNSWDARKHSLDIAAILADRHDLHRVTRQVGYHLPTITRGEMELASRSYVTFDTTCPRYMLAVAILRALAPGTNTLEQFTANLARQRVSLRLNRDKHGGIVGSRYELDRYRGVMTPSLKGSAIGSCYGWQTISNTLMASCHDGQLQSLRTTILGHARSRESDTSHDPSSEKTSANPRFMGCPQTRARHMQRSVARQAGRARCQARDARRALANGALKHPQHEQPSPPPSDFAPSLFWFDDPADQQAHLIAVSDSGHQRLRIPEPQPPIPQQRSRGRR